LLLRCVALRLALLVFEIAWGEMKCHSRPFYCAWDDMLSRDLKRDQTEEGAPGWDKNPGSSAPLSAERDKVCGRMVWVNRRAKQRAAAFRSSDRPEKGNRKSVIGCSATINRCQIEVEGGSGKVSDV